MSIPAKTKAPILPLSVGGTHCASKVFTDGYTGPWKKIIWIKKHWKKQWIPTPLIKKSRVPLKPPSTSTYEDDS